MKYDWKFYLTLAATVLIPIWIWQSESSGNNLELRQTSYTEIQPETNIHIQDLKVTYKDKLVTNLISTTFTLSNSGSKPIVSSSFETPIEISVPEGIDIIGSSVAYTVPKDIKVTLKFNSRSITIAPLLLNPGDKILFAVLTSGGRPFFTPSARIAGVKNIVLVESTRNVLLMGKSYLSIFCSQILIASYMILAFAIFRGGMRHYPSPIKLFAIFAAFIFLISGGLLITGSLQFLGMLSLFPVISLSSLGCFVGIILIRLAKRITNYQ